MGRRPMAAGDEIAELLRDAIISGEYKPRERLIEAELSQRYNVSRTPVREAIRNLAAAGLVTVEPYKGAVVADIDVDEIREIYTVRVALEGLATRLAATRVPEEALQQLAALEGELERYAREGNAHAFGNVNETFHHKLYSYCGNRVLIEMIDDLLERSALFRRSSWNSSARNTQRVIQGHRAMLEAVAARDAEAAQAAAEAHIRLFLSQSLNAVD